MYIGIRLAGLRARPLSRVPMQGLPASIRIASLLHSTASPKRACVRAFSRERARIPAAAAQGEGGCYVLQECCWGGALRRKP